MHTVAASPGLRDRPDVVVEAPSPSDLSRIIRRGFGLRKFTPPTLPHVALKIMSLAQSDEVEVSQIVEVLAEDAMLAARVMGLMNTTQYAAQGQVTSLEQAVMRIGLKGIRSLVAEAALDGSVFSSDGYGDVLAGLRQHGIATARVARFLAEHVHVEPEQAFMAGLFHDLGIAGGLLVLSDAYPKEPPGLDSLWPEISRIHSKVGWHLATSWGLPESLRSVMAFHHGGGEEDPHAHLCSVICVADWLVIQHDAHPLPLPTEGTSQEVLDDACAWLGIGGEMLGEFHTRAGEIVAEVEEEG